MKATEQQKKRMREYQQRTKEARRLYKRKYYQEHQEQMREEKKRYYQLHRDRILQDTRGRLLKKKYRRRVKEEVLTHYGNGRCACVICGFSDIRALSIDHINGYGRRHLKHKRITGIYNYLRLNGYPEGYQTLCMNCQFIKKNERGENRWQSDSRIS